MAALDRYLAIARYEWYKKKVTNRDCVNLRYVSSDVRHHHQSVLDWLLVRLHLLHQFDSHALGPGRGPGLEFVAGTRLPRSLLEDFLGIQNSDAPVQDQYHRHSESLTVKFLNISSRNNADSGI
jgi:hypothetical protein